MSIWTLFQVALDLFMLVGFIAVWMRLKRPPQDDPRLSRGLQLLQTKITVLEDLSDRTDAQVKQLSGLLDQKARFVQNKILEAEQQVLKIDHSMNKSLEVAEIFQDKIPHQEILERQRTVEYVKAARLAHSGLSVDEISAQVPLPREQVELIAKFNREQLMFDESQLPQWATRQQDGGDPNFAINNQMDFVNSLEQTPPQQQYSEMARIENEFKQAVKTANQAAANPPLSLMETRVAETLRSTMNSGLENMQPAMMSIKATAQTLRDKIVSTAEDLLRAQGAAGQGMGATPGTSRAPSAAGVQHSAGASTSGGSSPIVRGDSATVKKVIFPRIER